MKKIVILFMLLSSFSAYSQDEGYQDKLNKNYKILESHIIKKSDLSVEYLNLKSIFEDIDNNNIYSDYKKYLLKSNAILFTDIIYSSENKGDLIGIAKRSFPISLCTAYQFRNNTNNLLNDILKKVLFSEERISSYNKGSKVLYSEEIMNKLKKFSNKNKEEISLHCSK